MSQTYYYLAGCAALLFLVGAGGGVVLSRARAFSHARTNKPSQRRQHDDDDDDDDNSADSIVGEERLHGSSPVGVYEHESESVALCPGRPRARPNDFDAWVVNGVEYELKEVSPPPPTGARGRHRTLQFAALGIRHLKQPLYASLGVACVADLLDVRDYHNALLHLPPADVELLAHACAAVRHLASAGFDDTAFETAPSAVLEEAATVELCYYRRSNATSEHDPPGGATTTPPRTPPFATNGCSSDSPKSHAALVQLLQPFSTKKRTSPGKSPKKGRRFTFDTPPESVLKI